MGIDIYARWRGMTAAEREEQYIVPMGEAIEANANLIAAAPELYEATSTLLALYRACDLPSDDVIAWVEAALAKAEGRS